MAHLSPSFPQPDVTEKYGSAPEYGSSVDGHPEVPEAKDGTMLVALSRGLGGGMGPHAVRRGCVAQP